jgi:hypothetical protein
MSDENVSQEVLDSIRKDFGEGAIVLIGEAPHMEIEAVSTGSFGLDFAIGIGGVPVGRITEIFGKEASGKTTICQQIIANAQQEGKQCAYIDMEHALDLDYVRRSTSKNSISLSQIQVKRLWKSSNDLSGVMTSELSLLIQLLHSSLQKSLRGIWEMQLWGSKLDLCPKPCGNWWEQFENPQPQWSSQIRFGIRSEWYGGALRRPPEGWLSSTLLP